MPLAAVTFADIAGLEAFLTVVDLTVAGLDAPDVRLWIDRKDSGKIIGSTGYELNADRRPALIRNVAVAPSNLQAGDGSRLTRFALDSARNDGAATAWLLSQRSGPFWQGLGFATADRLGLAAALPDTHQVRPFIHTGQLDTETAWSLRLDQ